MISMTMPEYRRGYCRLDGNLIRLNAAGSTQRINRAMVEVLSVLLIRHPHPASAAEIIQFLWPDPDLEPEYAANGVKRAIHFLRKLLGAIHLETLPQRGWRLHQLP